MGQPWMPMLRMAKADLKDGADTGRVAV